MTEKQTVTDQRITSLAEALRGELELGSDGSTFETTIRLWLNGDYDGPNIPTESETRALGPHDTARLVDAFAPLRRAFGTPYLVGSALTRRDPRDIDVRLMLADDDPFLTDGTRVAALSLAVSVYLRHVTDLPVDFQFQSTTEGNAHQGPRSALIAPQEATR